MKNPDIHELFKPNLTPEEMFSMGIFGGSYFREIYCTVNQKYITHNSEFKFCTDNDSPNYRVESNYYGVKCGMGLEYWQERGWISPQDPYGWVQWYCRYYYGRRSEDDTRQINRWIRAVDRDRGRFVRWSRRSPENKKLKQIILHWAVHPDSI